MVAADCFQAMSRYRQQVDRPHGDHENRGEQWSGERSGRAAGGDDAEQAFGLFVGKGVGHEAPEYRYDEQVVYADPDEKGAGHIGMGQVRLE